MIGYEIVALEPRGGYRLWLRFADGSAGEVDLATRLSFSGVFELLEDPVEFAKVRLDLDTIVWPNGADIAPETLYEWTTGRPWKAVDSRR